MPLLFGAMAVVGMWTCMECPVAVKFQFGATPVLGFGWLLAASAATLLQPSAGHSDILGIS